MKKLLTFFTALLLFGSMTLVQADYYVAGTMNSWNAGSNDWKMSGSNPYSFTKQMASGTYQFKVTNGSWNWSTADFNNSLSNVTLSSNGGNIQFTLSDESNVTFYYNGSKVYVQAVEVVVPSYTFTAGTTIYYDFSGYGKGVNLYNSLWNNEWKSNVSNIISCTLSSDWKVTASTVLFRSEASSWNNVTCSTLPEEGHNMLISTNGSTYTWGTYVPPVNPTVDFVSLGSTIGVGLTANFAATSTNVDNPVYTFYVKKGSSAYGSAVTSYTFAEAGTYTVKVEVNGDNSKHAENTKEITVVGGAHIIYCVNKDAWAQVNAHMWGVSPETTWPGDLMTLTASETEKHNYPVYAVTFTPNYTNIIFSNDGSNQTPDQGINYATPYYYNGAWYASLADCDPLTVTLSGLEDNYLVGATSATISASSDLTNATYTYQLKIDDGEFAALSSNPYTFAAAGTYTFKVTATGDEGSKTATKEVTVSEPLTLYFVNKEGWATPYIYIFTTDYYKVWPGEAMTLTEAKTEKNEYAVYSYTFPANLYSKVIFSNNGANQTSDLDIVPSTPYRYNGEWFATLAECDPNQGVDFTNVENTILQGTTITFEASSTNITNAQYTFYVKEEGGSYGDAVASYTFSTLGKYVVKVEATGDNTESAIVREKTVEVYTTHTFTSGTKIYVDFSAVSGDVKGVNFPYNNTSEGLDHDASGAGTVKTITFSTDVTWSTLQDFIKTQKAGYNGLKFTVPAAGQDMVVVTADGASYTWGTYVPDVKMGGKFFTTEWITTADFTVDVSEDFASITLQNVPKGTHEFKVILVMPDGDAWRSTGGTFTRANYSAAITGNNDNNMIFTADIAGNYTFTWTYATNTLEITYPALPAQSVAFNDLAAQILKGTEVTFAATATGVTNPTYTFYVKEKNGEYGDAVASYTFNTIGEYVVKVSVEGDNTIDPVVNEENVEVYETHTFTSGTKIYVDFSAMTEGAKGINWPSVDAANVNGSTWQHEANGAGSVKTVTFTTDVTWSTLYNFINTEKNGWNGLRFSVPAAGENCAVVAADGASYTWATRMPTIALHSNFTNPDWEGSADFVVDGNNETASLTIAINQGDSYQFGVKVDGDWRANGSAFDRFNNLAEIPAGNTGNCTFVADATGDYTFTWTYSSNTLSVDYPTALAVALTGLNASQLVDDEVTVGATSNLTNVSYSFELKIDDGEFAALGANPYTFADAGTYTFKVTATGDEGSKTATKEVTVYEPLTLYFVNKEGWSNLHAYAYYGEGEPKNANWPGATMELTAATTANHGYTVYSVIVPKDVYTTAIFNNGNGGYPENQTGDMAIDNDAPYYYNGAWYATLAECDPIILTTDFYLLGSFNGWTAIAANRFMKATQEATIATTTVHITEYSNITFKLMENGDWCGAASAVTLDKDHNTTTIPTTDGSNFAMTPYAAGDYIFTLDLSTRELTVTYPDGEAMPIPTNIFLAGSMNEWAPSAAAYKFNVLGDVATLAVDLAEMADYGFKLVYNGTWYGANWNFNYYWNTDVPFAVTPSEDGAANLYSFKAGTYTFTLKISTMELTIGFPATTATEVEISNVEYATLYSDKALDVPAGVEAYIIPNVEGTHLTMEPIYRIPANTGVILHAAADTYNFYEGDGRYIDAPVSNLLKGTTTQQTIENNGLVHYVLSYDNQGQVGLYWPTGTGAGRGVGEFTNNAGKAYLELPEQSAGVIARRGFPFNPHDVPTGIDTINEENNGQKLILNGQLIIIRDGKAYNALGQTVK